MNKSSLLDLLDELADLVAKARADVESGVVARIRDGWNGHPRSPSFEAGASGRPRPPETLPDELRGDVDYSDPVGRIVAATGGLDRGKVDARTVLNGIAHSVKQMRSVTDTTARYRPRPPGLFDADEIEEPGCVSCARVDGPGTVGLAKNLRKPWWNPVHATPVIDGKESPVCRWCWEGEAGVKRTGGLPDVLDVVAYRDTGRARKKGA